MTKTKTTQQILHSALQTHSHRINFSKNSSWRIVLALVDIAVQPELFESSINTWRTLAEVIQTVSSLRSVLFCSIDWDKPSFTPIATALQNSLVSKISFVCCSIEKPSCAMLKHIFKSPDVPRSLFFDVNSATMESGHINTLMKMTKSARGLKHLGLWNSSLLTKEELNEFCQALVGETTTSSVQELDLAPPAPGRLWSDSDLSLELSQVLIKKLPYTKSLRRIAFSVDIEDNEQIRELLSAIYGNGTILSFDIRINRFQESDYEFIRQCEQRNMKLLDLLLVAPEESQVSLALRSRLFHHANGTRLGATMTFCSLLKMVSIGKPDVSLHCQKKRARRNGEE